MKRDTSEFKKRFQRWKKGEQVYSAGRFVEYQDGKDDETVIEKKLPEIIITPDKSTIQLRKNMQRIIPDKKLRNDFYQYLSSLDDHIEIPVTSDNDKLKRFLKLHSESNHPRIKYFKPKSVLDRSYYMNVPIWHPMHNTMHIARASHVIPELSHAFQYNNKLSYDLDLADNWYDTILQSIHRLPMGSDADRRSYSKAGHYENSAHNYIEPAIKDYVQGISDTYEDFKNNLKNRAESRNAQYYTKQLIEPYSNFFRKNRDRLEKSWNKLEAARENYKRKQDYYKDAYIKQGQKYPGYAEGKDDETIMAYYPDKDYYVGEASKLPEVVVTGKRKKKPKPYWVSPRKGGPGDMSLTASDVSKGIDAAIGPLMNWVTPSRYVGAIRESSNLGEFAVNMLSGKYGVTTDEYTAKHPILSILFNVGLDTAVPLATAGGFRAFKNYNASHLGKSNISRITTENAVSLTPEQWTAAQDAAIARGDVAEAQRLRDLHFKVSAPNTQIKDIQYHGAKGNAIFNVFDPKLIGQTDQGWAGRGYYFTPSKDYAKMYGSEPRAFYINAQKVHDGTASTYFGREDGPAAQAFKIIRKKHGNDGQQILDNLASSDAIRTSFPQTRPYNGTFEEVVTRNNNQMKLADAVTYDDKGVRIPLGSRDNFGVNDIRYSANTNPTPIKPITNREIYDDAMQVLKDPSILEYDDAIKWRYPEIENRQFSEDVQAVINNSILPRLEANRLRYRGTIMRPTVKSHIDDDLSRGYTYYPDQVFEDAGKSNSGGLYNPITDNIATRAYGNNKQTIHELRHRIDKGLPITDEEYNLLSDAYGKRFLELQENFKGANMHNERITTNGDARYQLLGEDNLKSLPVQKQNELIANATDEQIFNAVENSNGYGQAYIQYLRKLGELTPQLANSFRRSMMRVGAIVPPSIMLINNNKQK